MASRRMHILNGKACIMAALLWCCSANTWAQEDSEYRYEIGAAAGMATYFGDFNSKLFGNIAPAGGAVFKFVLNPHSAMKFSGTYLKLNGDYDLAQTYYPDLRETGYSYNADVIDIAATYEYNFWPYGTGKEYRGAMRFAPFISLGIGLTGVKNENRTVDYSSMTHEEANNKIVTANIPLGFGVKYRYKDRINFAVQWQMHFTLSDQMDGLKDTYRIKSSGLFKNTDCYSTLMFSLTYSISPKCPTCMKDR